MDKLKVFWYQLTLLVAFHKLHSSLSILLLPGRKSILHFLWETMRDHLGGVLQKDEQIMYTILFQLIILIYRFLTIVKTYVWIIKSNVQIDTSTK